MKNALKLIGTLSRWLCAIAFVVIIGFTLTAAGCDNGTTGGGGNKNNPNTGSGNYTQADLQGSWVLTGVPPNDNRTLIVTLTFTGNRFTFKSEYFDGSSTQIGTDTGTFTVSGDILTMTYVDGPESYKISISGNKMTWYDPDGKVSVMIFTKQ